MEAVDVRGRFVWHELLTRDVAAAKKFYSSLTGWKAQAWPPDPNYTVCHAGDAPIAGIMPFPPDVPADTPAHWLPYIGTRDVDGTVAAAVRAGGAICKEPADMPGAGRFAILKDPQGATFAIIDPENPRPEIEGTPPAGHFSWHELSTTDHEAAFAFYSRLFGWDAMQRMDIGPSGIYLIFGWNGAQKGGIYIKAPGQPGPPSWLSYANVASVDEAAPRVTAGGGTIWQPPMEVPGGGRITIFQDPTGAAVALYTPQETPVAAVDAARAVPKPASPATASKPKVKSAARVKPKQKATKQKPKVKAKRKAAPAASKNARAQSKVRVKTKAKSKAKLKAKSKAKAGTRGVGRRTPAKKSRAPLRKKSAGKSRKKTVSRRKK